MIREMCAADTKAAAMIEKELFTDAWTEQGFIDSLKEPTALFLAAEGEDGSLQGYIGAYYVLDDAEIVNVAVTKSCQGQGIGLSLVHEMLTRLREKKVETVVLEVRIGNAPARHVYEKAGFEAIGIRKDFYELPREDAMIMKKDI